MPQLRATVAGQMAENMAESAAETAIISAMLPAMFLHSLCHHPVPAIANDLTRSLPTFSQEDCQIGGKIGNRKRAASPTVRHPNARVIENTGVLASRNAPCW
ncbi:MAG TPA: hypothetical protein VKT82_24680 [Ktedonobacterales bacterium]|nr:hypothetical protein [Ktedonobacterales bacterium]